MCGCTVLLCYGTTPVLKRQWCYYILVLNEKNVTAMCTSLSLSLSLSLFLQKKKQVTKKLGHTLFDTDYLLDKVGNNPITTIKDFKEVLHLAGKPDSPVDAPPVPLTTYEDSVPEEFQ